MSYDPELREYILYLFLQELRQLYYQYGDGYSFPLETISENIKSILLNKGYTKENLTRFKVGNDFFQSVIRELRSDGYVSFSEKSHKGGFLKMNTKVVEFYKITESGLHRAKTSPPPLNPFNYFR